MTVVDGHDGGMKDGVECALSPEIAHEHCSVSIFFSLKSTVFYGFPFSVKKKVQNNLVNSMCILESATTELKSDSSNYWLCDFGQVIFPRTSPVFSCVKR